MNFKLFIITLSLLSFGLNAQTVDHATGQFSFSLPLISLPVSGGDNIDISAFYTAGISPDQPASEIGLGWALNAGGAITRTVNNIPDEWSGVSVERLGDDQSSTVYGAFKLKDAPVPNSTAELIFDLKSSDYLLPKDITLEQFSFDAYQMSAPGLAGTLIPRLNEYLPIEEKEGKHKVGSDFYNDNSHYNFQKPVNFHLLGEFAGPMKMPGTFSSGYGYQELFFNGNYDDNNKGVNNSDNRLIAPNYIEYFTNTEIISGVSGLILPNESALGRHTFRGDDIGGFRVTDPMGVVYHFTLPVYTRSRTEAQYPLSASLDKYDYNPIDGADDMFYGQYVKVNDYTPIVKEWRLVAITGKDYIDNGPTGIDETDKGYFVYYHHKKWANLFKRRFPIHGMDYQYVGGSKYDWSIEVGEHNNLAKSNRFYGSFSESSGEKYYLDRIESKDYSLLFIRSIRSDEISSDAKLPQLKLDKIILVGNNEITSFPSKTTLSSTNSLFDMSLVNKTSFYSNDWLLDFPSDINPHIIQEVDFETDYSLTAGYFLNEHIYVDGIDAFDFPNEVSSKYESELPAGRNSSQIGKLTLNEIVFKGRKGIQYLPSYSFEYGFNPQYDSQSSDIWGNYANVTFDEREVPYPTDNNHEDAWSMVKLTFPSGKVVEPKYESNRYDLVLNGKNQLVNPSKVYYITDAILDEEQGGQGLCTWDIKLGTENELQIDKHLFELVQYNGDNASNIQLNSSVLLLSNHYEYVNAFGYLLGGEVEIDWSYHSGAEYSRSNSKNIIGRLQVYDTDDGTVDDKPCSEISYMGNGYLKIQNTLLKNAKASGLRVKELHVSDGTNSPYVTKYEYEGGIVGVEPQIFEVPGENTIYSKFEVNRLTHFSPQWNRTNKGLVYSTVRVKNMGNNNTNDDGWIEYHYKNYDDVLNQISTNVTIEELEIEEESGRWCGGTNGTKDSITIIEFEDKRSSFIGLPIETIVYDGFGNKISESKKTYTLSDGGVLKKKFAKYFEDDRVVGGGIKNDCAARQLFVSEIKHHPVVLTTEETTSQYGTIRSTYSNFDEVLGKPLSTLSQDANGRITNVDIVPAHHIYTAMGPKTLDVANANILGLNAEVISTKTTFDGAYNGVSNHVVSVFGNSYTERDYNATNLTYENASVTTANWLLKDRYYWKGNRDINGIIPSGYSLFDFNNPSSSSSEWTKMSKVDFYGPQGQPLQMSNEEAEFIAYKYDPKMEQMLSKATNTNYESFTFCGFEFEHTFSGNTTSFLEGEHALIMGTYRSTSNSTIAPHSGDAYLTVPAGGVGIEFVAKKNGTRDLLTGRYYEASCWVHASSPDDVTLEFELHGEDISTTNTINESGSVNKISKYVVNSGDWRLMKIQFYIPENYVSMNFGNNHLRVRLVNNGSAPAYIDDFMVRPAHASVETMIYDKSTKRLTYQINSKNYGTKLEYDGSGKIIRHWQELAGHGYKLIKEKQYNYSRNF